MSNVLHVFQSDPNRSYEKDLMTAQVQACLQKEIHSLEQVQTVQAQLGAESLLVTENTEWSLAADKYILLRYGLRELWDAGELNTLLITSAMPSEGKTLTALNLAMSLSEHGRYKVAVIEGDFRKPALCARLGLEPWPGLLKCLQEQRGDLSALRRVDPLGFYLLPAGETASRPTALLGSETLSGIIDELKACMDWVIIDAPPASPIPDVLAMKKHADGCLWVLRAGSTPREAVEEGIRLIGRDFILGMVLNNAEEVESSYSKCYEYYGSAV